MFSAARSLLPESGFEPDWPFDIGESPFRVKGTPFLGALEYADRAFPDGRDAVLKQVERDDVRAFLQQPFMPSGWYDIFPLLGLAVATGRVVGLSPADYTRQRAGEQAEEDIRGLYRFLLRFTTGHQLVRSMTRITSQLFDFGGAAPEDIGPKHAIVVRTGMPAALATWYEVVTSSYGERAMQLAGMRMPRVSVSMLRPAAEAHGVPMVDMPFRFEWA